MAKKSAETVVKDSKIVENPVPSENTPEVKKQNDTLPEDDGLVAMIYEKAGECTVCVQDAAYIVTDHKTRVSPDHVKALLVHGLKLG